MYRFICALAFCLVFAASVFAESSDSAEVRAEKSMAADFVKIVQGIVKSGNIRELAGLISYPLTLNGKPRVKNAAAFGKEADAIINKNVRECVLGHDLAQEVFSRNGQYMIGWGCIWFSPDEKGGMRVDSIDNRPKP